MKIEEFKLNKYIEDYLDYLKYEKKLSENTYLSYKDNLKKFNLYFSKKDITKIEMEDIKKYLYALTISSKTKAHYLTVVTSFYKYLVNEDIIKFNPAEGIKMPKLEKKLPNYLSIDEIDKLFNIKLDTPIDYRNIAMLEVLYGTGMRISELINLTLSNIDYSECIIRVMGKGKKERIIPLNSTALIILKEYIDIYRPLILKMKASEYAFISSRGTNISRQGFFKIIKKLAKDNGISKNISPHILRHSFATHLLNNGANLRIVQELLGHENLVTTEIYAHLGNKKIEDDYQNHPHA